MFGKAFLYTTWVCFWCLSVYCMCIYFTGLGIASCGLLVGMGIFRRSSLVVSISISHIFLHLWVFCLFGLILSSFLTLGRSYCLFIGGGFGWLIQQRYFKAYKLNGSGYGKILPLHHTLFTVRSYSWILSRLHQPSLHTPLICTTTLVSYYYIYATLAVHLLV